MTTGSRLPRAESERVIIYVPQRNLKGTWVCRFEDVVLGEDYRSKLSVPSLPNLVA